MNLSRCAKHGEYLVRVRLAREDDGTYRVSRLLYAGESDAAASYRAKAERLPPEKKRRLFWQRRPVRSIHMEKMRTALQPSFFEARRRREKGACPHGAGTNPSKMAMQPSFSAASRSA